MMFKKDWTKWQDVGCFGDDGLCYLLQMKVCNKTGKKKFKKRYMGFVGDKFINNEAFDRLKGK